MSLADRAAKIARMRSEGMTYDEIADELRVSKSTAHKHGTRAGAPARSSRDITRATINRALLAYGLRRQGKTFAEIARILGLGSKDSAWRLARRGAHEAQRRARAGVL